MTFTGLQAQSAFTCADQLVLPSSTAGALVYDWVADGGGRGTVVAEFVLSADGSIDTLKVTSRSSLMSRWVERSLRASKFNGSCKGQAIRIEYTVVVHKKIEKNLPETILGPGNKVYMEFYDYVNGPDYSRPVGKQ